MADFNRRFRFIHIASWVLILLLIFWVLWSEGVRYSLLISISLSAILAGVFYSHHFVLKHFYESKKYVLYFGSLLLICIIAPPLFFLSFKSDFSFAQKLQAHQVPSLILTGFGVILSGIVFAFQEWFLRTMRRKEIEQQNTNAELLYLKTQINPHFLFNTLNNIHGLAIKNSPQISEVILRLATLMRYMLYESNTDKVPLEREITYLENFIELQQIRYKAKNIVKLDIHGDTSKHQVAPLLFIHLVENAWKHSPNTLDTGDIQIRLHADEDCIQFSIQNPIRNTQINELNEGGGIGLSNLKKRLALLYPNSMHQFKVIESDGSFIVNMTLQNTKMILE